MMPFHKMSEMTNWMRHHLPKEVRDLAFRPMNMVEFKTFTNPIMVNPVDGSRCLHLCFDVKGFKPEEINVTFSSKDKCFTVECKHDVKDKDCYITRNYVRKFVIPEDLHIDCTKLNNELKSYLTPDGMLVVEAMLPFMTPEELKAIREKTPSKTTSHMPTAMNSCGVFGLAVPVPVKTN